MTCHPENIVKRKLNLVHNFVKDLKDFGIETLVPLKTIHKSPQNKNVLALKSIR